MSRFINKTSESEHLIPKNIRKRGIPRFKAGFFFSVFLFLAPVFSLSAQEGQDKTVYVIREIEFDIEGRTRPFALIANGEFREGERIEGRENLDKYLALKRQILINQQVLEDASVEYSLGESEEDGALPVKLLVHVKDTWNLIVLPYPKYDSNEGFSFTLKARDYNFLGTMSALRLDLGYTQEDGDNTVNFSVESDTPFYAAGLHWNLNFDHFLALTFGEPLYYQNVTGLSLRLPWNTTSFTVGFNQYLTFNEENSDEDRDNFGLDERYYGPYGSSELFASWKIPFGPEVGDFGAVTYTPGISGKLSYPYGKMDEARKPVTTLNHSLGFGRIDWMGNYRRGLAASLSNSFSWYYGRSDAPLKIVLDGNAEFHWPFAVYAGVSARVKYRQWWQWSERQEAYLPYYRAGDSVRGLPDEDIRAHQILSLNLDFPFRFVRFRPSEWFGKPKLHIFDFETHISPFADIAMFGGPYNRLKEPVNPAGGATTFGLEDMITTAGLELLVFPAFFRSLKIRASIGYNLKRIKNEGLSLRWGFFPDWDEIFIGLDHYY